MSAPLSRPRPEGCDLAPRVIVRAAAWPTSALTGLADAAIAQTAIAAIEDRSQWATYEARYEASLQAQREELHRRTMGDPTFLLALTVTNPSLPERLASLDPKRKRNKRVRHHETTLYRYLARAVGRTEPCDLWAGTELASWSQSSRMEPVDPRVSMTPDLRPFQALLRALRATPRYRGAGLWKANVTLRREPSGSWQYWAREGCGHFKLRSLKGGHELDAALDALSGAEPDTLGGLAALVASRTNIAAAAWTGALIQLGERGALVGGLDLAARFESAWEALQIAGRQLEGDDRRAWWRAYAQLRRICRRVSGPVRSLDIAAVQAGYSDAAAVITTLADALGVETPELPRVVLRCDRSLGFAVTLGVEMRERIARSIAAYEGLSGSLGLVDRLRLAERARAIPRGPLALDSIDLGVPPSQPAGSVESWQELGARLAAGGRDFADVVDRWEALLSSSDRVVTATTAPSRRGSPFGSLLVAPSGDRWVVHGVSDEALAFHARFAAPGATPGGRDPLVAWYGDRLAAVEASTGVVVADLVGPFERNPNVLARPAVTRAIVDPWGASPGQLSLRGGELRREGASGQPLLHVSASPTPVAVCCHASAHLAAGDALSRHLLLSSFRLTTVPPAFHASAMAFDGERAAAADGARAPAVETPCGDLVRPRRSTLSGAPLAALVDAPPALRFALWQRLARAAGWAPLLMVRRGNQSQLCVVRDSPISVEALFEGARAETQLTVDDAEDETFLEDSHGNRYKTQLAVPFVRRESAWQDTRPRSQLDPVQREAAPQAG